MTLNVVQKQPRVYNPANKTQESWNFFQTFNWAVVDSITPKMKCDFTESLICKENYKLAASNNKKNTDAQVRSQSREETRDYVLEDSNWESEKQGDKQIRQRLSILTRIFSNKKYRSQLNEWRKVQEGR